MKIVSVLALASIAGMASAQAVSVGNGNAANLGNDPFSSRATLWDNGDTDGSNGYSNATSGVFGASRSLLDDFEVTDSAGWILNDFHSLTLWSGGGSGIGTGYNLTFWSDNAGSPGAPMMSANVNSYMETPTGRTWFSRPEMRHDVTFDDVFLPQGRYWVEMQVIGPDNNFHMVRSTVTGSEAWVNYDDLGGLQSGSAIFGAPADLAFSLTGEIAPAPGALALLGLGGIAAIRRRR
ncbi:MAG: hypothetical protein Q9O74_00790 [Planctomycetota bacterium]|nr:hypothetical protein [Planctomycetota bacterium]